MNEQFKFDPKYCICQQRGCHLCKNWAYTKLIKPIQTDKCNCKGSFECCLFCRNDKRKEHGISDELWDELHKLHRMMLFHEISTTGSAEKDELIYIYFYQSGITSTYSKPVASGITDDYS